MQKNASNAKQTRKLVLPLLLLIVLPVLIFAIRNFTGIVNRATYQHADIVVDTRRVLGPMPSAHRALAQGGEEYGVRMIEPVVSEVADLQPRYIRIDHIYDFYNVVSRDSAGNLLFVWDELDATVCDILRTGAKPFFSLGYMPETMSSDGSLIAPPKDWNEWALLVQRTVERYSALNPQVCGGTLDQQLTDIYYEVWNEPDLETFGKWSIHGGDRDYKVMYYYSAMGAQNAQNVGNFYLGGPATTAPYQNWMVKTIQFAQSNNLKLDFLSWHRYSEDPNVYGNDMRAIDTWLAGPTYEEYRNLPRIVSEWGFDSDPNPLDATEMAAAHTVLSIRNLIEEDLELAFAFEIKDGPKPSWGILTYEGEKKPRYEALRLLSSLGRNQVLLSGEGSHVKGIASKNFDEYAIILANYDRAASHTETVPITFLGLEPGSYTLTQEGLDAQQYLSALEVGPDRRLATQVYMDVNSVILLTLTSRN